jgi:hypothetical protein
MRSSYWTICLLFAVTVLSACGGRAYTHGEVETTAVVSRAETQSEGPVTVRASIPGEEETLDIFGVPLYDNGIQPVWIEIHNAGDKLLRYAPVGTDRLYFSALEVAWKHRGPFTSESRAVMERRFNDLAMPRIIEPGSTASGFVFSNFRPGVKAFNVELFGDNESYDFTFVVNVPGFRPDYTNVDFENLYALDDIVKVDIDEAWSIIRDAGCCATDADGEFIDAPINVVLVGEGIDLLRSLLRGNWHSVSAEEAERASPSYLFGRRQDAIFRYQGTANKGYYELRLWLTRLQIEGDLVSAGQVRLIIDNPWSITRPDPDVDLARMFLVQNMWYSQSLKKVGRIRGPEVIPVESIWADLFGRSYFTDGYRVVMWLSADPVSLVDTVRVAWDESGEEVSE